MGVVQMVSVMDFCFWEEVLALFVAGPKEIPSGLCAVHVVFGSESERLKRGSHVAYPKPQAKQRQTISKLQGNMFKAHQAQTETLQEGYLPHSLHIRRYIPVYFGCLS